MPPHPQHHHHSHCHSSSPSPSPSPCCSFSTPSPPPSCCSCCCGCRPSPQSPPPPPDQMVVLLQSLLSNQLHISNPPPTDHHLLQTLANHHLKPYAQPPQRQHKDPDSKTQSLLLSLLRRVSALESQLPDLSRPPPPPPPVVPASAAPKPSLRDVAARTIQARFREFLVRRSRALRHLKQLAALKSHAAALRSSLSGKVRVADSERVSQRAMDLLLQLDSIQSSDLMIREGKKSITRELTRILEFVDKVSPKENRNWNSIKEDGAGTDPRRRHWQNSKAVKRVSFSEFDSYAPFAEDLIDLSGEMARLDEEHAEDAEVEVENGVRYGIGRRKLEVHNGNLGLYAPMPVHMEPKES